MAKRKRTAKRDLALETALLAEEDLAAMRPALAVAPELVLQTLQRQRRRAKKKAAKPARTRKSSAKKSAAKKARKASPRKKKATRARKK
jgi:hypothetical protein